MMEKRMRIAQRFGIAMMIACFLSAAVAAVVAALVVFNGGDLTLAGLAIGGTGVWIALGFFFYAEQSRFGFEACLDDRLNDMVKRLEKCECRCQVDPVAE